MIKQIVLYHRRVKNSEQTDRFISNKSKNSDKTDRFISHKSKNHRTSIKVSITEEKEMAIEQIGFYPRRVETSE